MSTTLADLRQQVAAIEAREPRTATPRPLAFTLQFRGWFNAAGSSEDVLARCLGMTVARLRRIYNHDLPTPAETRRLADAMAWPAERLAALIEADRVARALREVA